MSRDDTTVIRHSKKLYFRINPEQMLNWLNFASWDKLRKLCEKSRELQRFLFNKDQKGEGIRV